MVTHRPPHRSVRAELLHTALTKGGDAKPLGRMRMDESARRQVFVEQPFEARPWHAPALTSTQQRMPPCAADLLKESGQPSHVVGHRMIVQYPCKTRRSHRPTTSTGSCRRRISVSRMVANVASIRFLIVKRTILKSPLLRRVLQQCVNPRKSKVSGLRIPRSQHCCAANRPKRISRVLSGYSCNPKRTKRSCNARRKRLASPSNWKPSTLSSA